MYRLMILDDEETIRKGLVEMLPWEELGFTVVADFEDGMEALSFLDHHPVDAILTDIMMVDVSGLDLAKHIHHTAPQIKVVIISGYKEFEFAQKAIQYNVSHYLLKPTKLEEIKEIFRNIKLELDKAAQAEVELNRTQQLLPTLQQQFFAELLAGALKEPRVLDNRIQQLRLPVSIHHPCYVIDVQLMNSAEPEQDRHENSQVVYSGLSKLFHKHELTHLHFYPVSHAHYGFKVVCVFTEEMMGSDQLSVVEQSLKKIQDAMLSLFAVEVEMLVESAYEKLSELAASGYTSASKQHTSALLIEKAQRFMQQHYDQDLSLEIVAEHVFLHPVYFSKLFKQSTDINFSEYLTQLRINKAMELLKKRRYKMYEVGEKVGYPNSKYFYRVFKQATGHTPKEYCRMHLGEG